MKSGSHRLQFGLNRRAFTFGRYCLCPDTRQLLRDGQLVTLNGKVFDLLIAFFESGGSVLTREDLYERLWGQRIVEEANLSQTVYLLRRTLDPTGDGRAFIETIPRVGYRFASPLRQTSAASSRPRLGMILTGAAFCGVTLTASALWYTSGYHTTISAVARDADELGEYHLALRTPDHLSYALGYFKEAEAAAPHDAFAYAAAASAYGLLAEFQPNVSARQRELVSLASASIAAALKRDARFSSALAVKGFIAYRFQGNRGAAARDLERALVFDPSDAQARLWHGILLMSDSNLPAATAEFQAAHRFAPTAEVYSRWLARAYAFERKPDQAIAEAQETLQIEPDDAPAMLTIAQAQEQRGNLESALNTLRTLVREDPYERPFVIPDAARLELRLGKADPSFILRRMDALAASGRVDPFETALLYLTIGRKAAAMRMLRLTSRWTLTIQRHDPRLLGQL
jgi:DNA-binding winged helix-turn-helix (wHTH) protein/Tfp pilus assembly protein PilF